jgi:pyruvate dehydrogenase (quinone)
LREGLGQLVEKAGGGQAASELTEGDSDMAKKTASDMMIEILMDWGVDTVFGIPGDGINGIMESLRTHKDKIKFIQVRHEEAAAFMATAYAKFTGKLGVCLATSGPGGIHLANGLYDAKLDGAAVLAITGLQFHDLLCTHTQQDVELDKFYMDCCVYNARIMGPAHVENVMELACRTALARRGPAHVTIPVDFQEMEIGAIERSKRNKPHHVSNMPAYAASTPAETDLQRAAEMLNKGKKIAILAGQGALDAGRELEDVAEKLGAPIVKALLGKAAVPDDSPYTTGGIGLLGTAPSQDALENCDTLLIAGSSFPYIEFYPKPGKVNCVQIDVDPTRIGIRYPADVGIVGDTKKILRALLPRLERNKNRDFLKTAQEGMKKWWKIMEERGTETASPMKPQVVGWSLNKVLDDDAIVITDSGTITTWFARQIKARRGMQMSLSGNLATMACGLPYANAAAIAFPKRQVVAIIGDGGLSMLMAELATAVKYQLDVKIVVIVNNVLGQIKWEQMVFLGNPEYGVQLHPIDFQKVMEACGGKAFTITKAKECDKVMAKAFNTKGPVVIQALVDQYMPPLPPKVNVEQALHFAESMLRGEPHKTEIITNSIKEKIREMV